MPPFLHSNFPSTTSPPPSAASLQFSALQFSVPFDSSPSSILLSVQLFLPQNSLSTFSILPPPPSQPLKGAANCPHLLPLPLHSKSVEDKDKDKDNKNTLTSSVLGQHKITQKVDVSFSYYYIFWPLHYHAHIIERVNSKVQIAPTWPTMTSTPHCDGIDNYKSATQLLRPPPSSSQFSPISS